VQSPRPPHLVQLAANARHPVANEPPVGSIWVSPGPPRKPYPPRCRSRWSSCGTNRPA
jgi:hypothetical protein